MASLGKIYFITYLPAYLSMQVETSDYLPLGERLLGYREEGIEGDEERGLSPTAWDGLTTGMRNRLLCAVRRNLWMNVRWTYDAVLARFQTWQGGRQEGGRKGRRKR